MVESRVFDLREREKNLVSNGDGTGKWSSNTRGSSSSVGPCEDDERSGGGGGGEKSSFMPTTAVVVHGVYYRER